MPSTYQLISSNVLGSSAKSVTFSAIPGTFTDLVIRLSLRAANASVSPTVYYLFNSDALGASGYSWTRLTGNGSSGGTSQSTNFGAGAFFANGDSSTSNTFSSNEIYIPNYLASSNKPVSVFSATETNATAVTIATHAELYSVTTAISSIKLEADVNFLTGSSFYLYGIKSS
jgi:hypothetical protein